jgi:hypothetical protein
MLVDQVEARLAKNSTKLCRTPLASTPLSGLVGCVSQPARLVPKRKLGSLLSKMLFWEFRPYAQ